LIHFYKRYIVACRPPTSSTPITTAVLSYIDITDIVTTAVLSYIGITDIVTTLVVSFIVITDIATPP